MILNPTTIDIKGSHVMAIINLTPDSFYSTSRHLSYAEVCQSVEHAVRAGATIVDLGGYSSRPGADEVSVEEEWRRVEMGLQAARDVSVGVVVSIDTFRAEVVRRAYEGYGAFIVNDITAGEADRTIIGVVAELGLPYVAMHMRGTPATMQSMTDYAEGVTKGVVDYFRERVKTLEMEGVERKHIILDPGFGFAKTVEQNHELLASLDELRTLGYPLLIGVSRKSMIYRPLGITAEESLPGSLALAWEALRGGDAIVRVHDVAATRQVVELAKFYKQVRYDKGR